MTYFLATGLDAAPGQVGYSILCVTHRHLLSYLQLYAERIGTSAEVYCCAGPIGQQHDMSIENISHS